LLLWESFLTYKKYSVQEDLINWILWEATNLGLMVVMDKFDHGPDQS